VPRIGGSVATIIVAILNGGGISVTPEVAAAIATVVSFATVYLKRG
jgi:hypothetical protein